MKPRIIDERKVLFDDSNGKELEWLSKIDVVDASFYPDEDLLVAILKIDKNTQLLQGVNLDGSERFKSNPPQDWSFYYLSSHIKHNVAVVCVSDTSRFDWFFGINPKTGELTSLNRAY